METAQDNTVAIVAILVSGGVALLAALVTPITAHYRQKGALREASKRLDRQLTAEADRLKLQLDAEHERLAGQLDHERRLHDLDGFRALLDGSSALIRAQMIDVIEMTSAVKRIQGAIPPEAFVKLDEVVRRLMAGQHDWNGLAAQLVIHLEDDDPMFVAPNSYMHVMNEAVTECLSDLTAEELHNRLTDITVRAGKHAVAFRAPARVAAGYRIA